MQFPLHNMFGRRIRFTVIAAFVLSLPLIIWGAIRALETNNNNIRQWLPDHYAETKTYDWFRRHFGSDEYAIVSWDGCRLDDERLERVDEELAGSRYFEDVHTGRELLSELTAPPFRLEREKAIDRLQGFAIGQDRATTCALVTLSPLGDADRVRAVSELRQVLTQRVGIAADELRLAGDPVFNAEIDIASEQAIGYLPIVSVIVAIGVALVSLRSVRLMLVVFATAAYCGALALSLVWFTGGNLNLVLVVMPVLIYVLSLSAAIHLVNYYRDASAESGPEAAPAKALSHGIVPCTFAALTTAIGVGSLQISHVIPIQDFGFYSAVGILASLVSLFVLFPALLSVQNGRSDKSSVARAERRLHRSLNRWLERYAKLVTRQHAWISVMCILCLCCGCFGVWYIDSSVTPTRFFPDSSRLLQDAKWFIDEFGPYAPIEFVLVFDNRQSSLNMLERARLVRDSHQRLLETDEVSAAMSSTTFVPALDPPAAKKNVISGLAGPLARIGGINRNRTWKYLMNSRLEEHRRQFVDHGYFRVSDNEELWRISVRTSGGDAEHYKELVGKLTARLDFFLQNEDPGRVAGVRVVHTGMLPLFFLAQQELLDGLFRSFLTAFALIAVLMVVVLRNWRGGLLAMLPNLFPAAVVFGYMGYRGVLIDIGSMLTASAAMGIAVDDTVHFLTWFRRGLDRGMTRCEAIVHAYQRCATAMMQTTAIAGLALVIYAGSSFQPVSQFGLLMFTLLVVTLVGDLLFLPALLAGPAGKVFSRQTSAKPLGVVHLGRHLGRWPNGVGVLSPSVQGDFHFDKTSLPTEKESRPR